MFLARFFHSFAICGYQTNMILTRHLSRNSQSLDLVANRAEQGGLTNVVIKSFSFAWDNLDSFSSEVLWFFILSNQQRRLWGRGALSLCSVHDNVKSSQRQQQCSCPNRRIIYIHIYHHQHHPSCVFNFKKKTIIVSISGDIGTWPTLGPWHWVALLWCFHWHGLHHQIHPPPDLNFIRFSDALASLALMVVWWPWWV